MCGVNGEGALNGVGTQTQGGNADTAKAQQGITATSGPGSGQPLLLPLPLPLPLLFSPLHCVSRSSRSHTRTQGRGGAAAGRGPGMASAGQRRVARGSLSPPLFRGVAGGGPAPHSGNRNTHTDSTLWPWKMEKIRRRSTQKAAQWSVPRSKRPECHDWTAGGRRHYRCSGVNKSVPSAAQCPPIMQPTHTQVRTHERHQRRRKHGQKALHCAQPFRRGLPFKWNRGPVVRERFDSEKETRLLDHQ